MRNYVMVVTQRMAYDGWPTATNHIHWFVMAWLFRAVLKGFLWLAQRSAAIIGDQAMPVGRCPGCIVAAWFLGSSFLVSVVLCVI